MALTPSISSVSPRTQTTRSRLTADQEAQQRALEQRQRLQDASEQLSDTEKVLRQRIDTVRDDYSQQEVVESARREAELENQRLKGYEQLRELKRAQEQEVKRVKKEGDTELNKLNSYYRDTLVNTERRESDRMNQMLKQSAAEMDYTQKEVTSQLEQSRANQTQNLVNQQNQHQSKIAEVNQTYQDDFERMRTATNESIQKSQEGLQERYDTAVAAHQEVIDKLNERSESQLGSVRADTAAKLAQYSEKKHDPFYRMVEFGAKFNDEGDHYTLTATVPDYEQKNVSISVRGKELVVQGFRRNEDKEELDPGHRRATASYQSFSETFPIEFPVDARKLSKEFEGDMLRVTVPKMNYTTHLANQTAQASGKEVKRKIPSGKA